MDLNRGVALPGAVPDDPVGDDANRMKMYRVNPQVGPTDREGFDRGGWIRWPLNKSAFPQGGGWGRNSKPIGGSLLRGIE